MAVEVNFLIQSTRTSSKDKILNHAIREKSLQNYIFGLYKNEALIRYGHVQRTADNRWSEQVLECMTQEEEERKTVLARWRVFRMQQQREDLEGRGWVEKSDDWETEDVSVVNIPTPYTHIHI